MKKLKLLFNVSEAALTAAVFVLVTALVPMDIILKLVSQSVINGNPCLYDALISDNVEICCSICIVLCSLYSEI